MRKPLHGAHNKIVAYIEETSSRIEVKNTANKLMAWYSKMNDETRDGNNRLLGKGDLTMRSVPL
jgi:hypothetical protein